MRDTDTKTWPQEHTNSYYAATANDAKPYPALDGDLSTDICVIGGGFTGVSTALTLAERGRNVVLLEANRVGWGASGRNGGQLINGMSGLAKIEKMHGRGMADMVWNLRWRGNTIVRDRVATYDIDCDLKDGYVDVARKPAQVADIESAADERERHNFPYRYEVWNAEKTAEMLGTGKFFGGFACYRDGHIHPLNLCRGEARAAQTLGARVFEQTPVQIIRHGTRPTVVTPHGNVQADAVVLAGNAYSKLEPKHLSNQIFPAGSYIIATEPLDDDVVREINPADVAVCDLNHVNDYYRLSADKRLLYGGACNYSGRDPRNIEAYIRPRMLAVYPRLRDVHVDYEWGGKIGIVLNRVPAVGRIDGNVYYCQGYSGHGVTGSHLMGEIMADAVGGTLDRFDLFAALKPVRIPGSHWVGNQIIALGMLYYKLRDLL